MRRQASRILAVLRDEDLGAVLEVAGGERARHAVEIREAVAETISRLLVLLRVGLQVIPQMIGQRVLGGRIRLEDVRI